MFALPTLDLSIITSIITNDNSNDNKVNFGEKYYEQSVLIIYRYAPISDCIFIFIFFFLKL